MSDVPHGLHGELGMQIVRATSDEVVLEWMVTSKHHQPMGIVHGGVHCSAIETACSIGASLSARERDPQAAAVGLENHTSFIRAVRSGTLRATARPITRGRTTQVWEAEVRDDQDRLVATGRVRLLCIAADAAIG
jgi:1,4-dihydroxy-2-naphthoyl-CoA hydrolase